MTVVAAAAAGGNNGGKIDGGDLEGGGPVGDNGSSPPRLGAATGTGHASSGVDVTAAVGAGGVGEVGGDVSGDAGGDSNGESNGDSGDGIGNGAGDAGSFGSPSLGRVVQVPNKAVRVSCCTGGDGAGGRAGGGDRHSASPPSCRRRGGDSRTQSSLVVGAEGEDELEGTRYVTTSSKRRCTNVGVRRICCRDPGTFQKGQKRQDEEGSGCVKRCG